MVVVTPGFPPVRGGVEEHAGRLVAELSAAGARVLVLTARRGHPAADVAQLNGVQVRIYPAWRLSALSVSPRLLAASLRHDSSEVDIWHVHSYHASAGAAVLNRRMRGRIVFTPHYHGGGHTPLARVLHVAYRFLGRGLFAAADRVICVSEAERERLVGDRPEVEGKTVVIPNGVAREELEQAEPYPGEPPTVVSLGRLEPYKRVDELIRAMPQVAPPTRLVVIGTGSHRPDLEELAAALGVADRVVFAGGIDTASVQRWLATAQVLVSLSEHEAFGMAPLEAAAAGARVVLSGIPAHVEITRAFLGEAAVLLDELTPHAVAAAVTDQLRHPERRPNAIPSWEEVAADTLRIYRELAAGDEVAGGVR